MRNKRKKGFTLVELTVVLVILGIIAAIAVPFFMNYWKKAEFRKNQENAKTAYLAAESKLTYYRSSGQWDKFKKEILKAAKDGTLAEKASFEEDGDSELDGRIYAIKLDKSAEDQTVKNNLLLEILDDYTYDKDFFNASISIEIDIESGEVYSAFYDSRCKGLNYKADDTDGYLTMQKRDYDSRKDRLLGYYSTEDTVNSVNLEAKRLRITTINLVNSEKLYLNWSSNAGSDLGVDYDISFYNKTGDKELFSVRVSQMDMRAAGWSTTNADFSMASLTVKDADGRDRGTWQFPVTYSDNKFSLVLDAMMSAKVQATLDKQTNNGSTSSDLLRTSSISITRLTSVASVLSEPQTIYAKVKATAYSGSQKHASTVEYRDSEQVKSNTANSMFGDDTELSKKSKKVTVTAFRHLSNIRYYEKSVDNSKKSETSFNLSNKNMDWTSAGTGVYDFKTEKTKAGDSLQKLTWRESSSENKVGFPTIQDLPAKYELTGKGSDTLISNLYLNEESVVVDETADTLSQSKTQYLGLFGEVEGRVSGISFKDPTLTIGTSKTSSLGSLNSLRGVGILAGRSEGTLEDVALTVSDSKKDSPVLETDLSNDEARYVCVGSLVGAAAKTSGNDLLNSPTSGAVRNLQVEGKMKVELPQEDKDKNIAEFCGVGGVVGYAKLNKEKKNVQISACHSSLEISANRYTGGIVGRVDSNIEKSQYEGANESALKDLANVIDCQSESLVRCTSFDTDSETAEGNYFGGIVGYADQALLYNVSSASGLGDSFSYSDHVDEKDQYLLGDYVGGIAGYAQDTLLANCSTQKNGYILGNDYVGGIAGGLGGSITEAIQTITEDAAGATVNASYVIGNNYVGGITGINRENVTLKNCINNGVAAAYEKYVGGIVGYNAEDSTIQDCASYLSDYDNSVFNMITNEWDAEADYAGGIAGYNNGAIRFSAESEAVTVKSVSSIVVGRDYIGGIAGFNDKEGTLDVNYTLIGGKIYAYGNCAGGIFGLNASESILSEDLSIKPSSLRGNYYVGGCIGANVVALTHDVTIDGIRTDNTLGQISGTAFCGGLIGYERTYSKDQLTYSTLLEALESDPQSLLPGLDDKGVPTKVTESDNEYTLTLTSNNNIPVQGEIYVGGIVGYCEKNSKLLMQGCENSGDLSLKGDVYSKGVVLGDFERSSEISLSDEEVEENADEVSMHFAGGIISINLENQIIDSCKNTGTMSGFDGIGGIVGLNAGLITNCSLNQHFGNAALNYVGGIAGVNIGTNREKTYDHTTYTTGTIEDCSTLENKTLSGNSDVGGIVGWNMSGGLLKDNTSNGNITGAGDEAIGGLAGRNSGTVIVAADGNKATRIISGANATGVGGIVGVNGESGTLQLGYDSGSSVVAVGNKTSVEGSSQVGGIIGYNEGSFGKQDQEAYIINQAKSVRATHGYAGGIVGDTKGDIYYGRNEGSSVTADQGYAGGITAYNHENSTIFACENHGNVSSSNGYAGGIAGENAGTINACLVGGQDTSVKIFSLGVQEAGAVVAVNAGTGTVADSKPEKNVTLGENASIYGGVAGRNQGTIEGAEGFQITEIPNITTIQGSLTVGGAVGINEENAEINNVSVSSGQNNETMTGFTGYRYLGGLVGDNYGQVKNSDFTGYIKEASGMAGNCYGGIAGINEAGASLTSCSIGYISMDIQGVYSATSNSSVSQKENLSTHVGGIVGKNEKDAKVSGCTLENNEKSVLVAKYGMLGGVAGFNKGSIEESGDSITADVMEADTLEQLVANAEDKGLAAASSYVAYESGKQLEELHYSGDNSDSWVSKNRLQMYMDTNGNIGGITAYNSTTGEVNECVSGNWFLSNKSEQVGVGTGGIIGMNESEKDTSKLVNAAFIGRYIKSESTNRFAGGIIGNQNNSTSKDWTIEMAVNFGTVYCFNTHYSGGIVGQWTGSGGTIRNCRNYGMLQTTYAAGWVGASGGIVAQLYHASDNHEYNIIGCENYGSIYKRNGSDGNGANDSAGILGNVTTFQTSTSQSFTIRILDCMNGPGVKIYSASMASGIFGFMSCDNPSAANIQTSTKDVKIQIERCRNFASEMAGSSFTGGIVGARYGGWDNTIVKDCYSPNFRGYGIFSNGINNGSDCWSNKPPGNYKNLFYYDVKASRGFYGNAAFALGIQASDNNITRGSGNITLTKASLSKFSGHCGSVDLLKTVNEKYVVVKMNSDVWWMNGDSCYIDVNNYVRNDSDGDKIIGQVLYEVDENYSSSSQISAIAVKETNPSKNTLAFNARESYRRIEGIYINASGREQLLAPTGASAEIEDGKLSISITPNTMEKSIYGCREDNTTKCDPFKYLITVTNDSETKTYELYEEEGSFDLPDNLTGQVSVFVQAVSMFDDVKASDSYEVEDLTIHGALPEPDVKLVIISQDRGDRYNHTYRVVLNNLEDYTVKDKNGEDLYPGWQVTVNIVGAGKITINKDNPAPTWSYTYGDNIEAASQSFQMISKASISGGSKLWEDSREVTSSVRLCNNYRPPRALKSWDPLTQTVTVTGTSLNNLAVKIELDAGSTATDVPPIYRAELVGDWKGESEVVFAKEDILLVSKGKASASFSNLPEAIKDASNLKVRLWFAATGEGPVYTYYEVDAKENANVTELVSVAEDGTPTYRYLHSTPLENYGGYYDNYINRLNTGISWLPAPVLEGADSDDYKEVKTTGDNGELYYTFSWDQDVSGTNNASYEVSMIGIDKNGKEVRIDTSDAYKSGKSLTIDGSKWNYTQVQLTVTRIGDSSSKQIGLTTTGIYKIKQRLTKPAQPSLSLLSQNELLYKLSWDALSLEEGVEGYQAYIQAYGKDDKLEEEKTLGELVTTDQKEGKGYRQQVDLENYAGKRVLIYLVAKAKKDAAYLDSESGITYELTIPERIKTPKVSWSIDWKHEQANYLEADAFEAGGLTVSLKADKDNIPPGGSAYLLKAYVYDSKEDAKSATATDPGTAYKFKYPLEESVTQMDVNSSTDYSHSLSGLSAEYAGKWIVFYSRISSGAGNVSSKWVKSDVYRLPYVQLKSPEISSEVEEGVNFTANVQSTPYVPGQDETWTGKRTYLSWESVSCASAYEVNLNGKITEDGSSGEKRSIGSKLRFIEGTDGVTVQIWREVEEKIGDTETQIVWKWVTLEEEAQDIPEGTAETDILHSFEIPDYGVTATGTYTAADGSNPVYTVTLSSQLVVQKMEDGSYKYSLKLPDVADMKAADDSTVTNNDFGISTLVEAYSNVSENVADVTKENAEQKSEAYVRSKECKIEW